MSLTRNAALAALVLGAVLLQVTVFSLFSVNGVVPDLVLLVVVAAAISRGPVLGATVGFAAGVLLDLVPPADHTAGRWALALVLAAALASRVAPDARRSPLATLAAVGACSFVATSVFALSGLLLGDHSAAVGEMAQVVGIALLWDLALASLLMPPLLAILDRTTSAELAY